MKKMVSLNLKLTHKRITQQVSKIIFYIDCRYLYIYYKGTKITKEIPDFLEKPLDLEYIYTTALLERKSFFSFFSSSGESMYF